MKRAVIFLLKVTLAVVLIVYLVRRQEIPFSELLRLRERWPWFLLAQIPFAAVLLVAAWRWQLLLGAQGIRYRLADTLQLTLVGVFFSQVMPGSTGGDFVKAYYVAREHPGRRGAGILTVFLDRLLGLFVLLVVAAASVLPNGALLQEALGAVGMAFLLSQELGPGIFLGVEGLRFRLLLVTLAVAVWVVVGAVVLGGTLFFSETVRSHPLRRRLAERLPFRRFFELLGETVAIYKEQPRCVALAALLSVGVHLGIVLMHVGLFLALTGEPPALLPFLLVVPLGQLVMAVPITPASWGTAEAAYNELFRFTHVSGFLVSLLQRLTYYLWALGGLVFYLKRRRHLAPGAVDPAPSGGPREGRPARPSGAR